MLYSIVWFLHVVITFLLIIVVLLQTGKGSEIGFALGAGTAQTMFGASGGRTFITKFTVILAVSFMCTSIFLAIYQSKSLEGYHGVIKPVKSSGMPEAPGAQQQAPASNEQGNANEMAVPNNKEGGKSQANSQPAPANKPVVPSGQNSGSNPQLPVEGK